jgi:hypothetical protein
MFSVFYPRDTQARRERYFHNDPWKRDYDKKLSALTDELYALDGGLSFHQIKGSMAVEGGARRRLCHAQIRAREEAAAVLNPQGRKSATAAEFPVSSALR